MSAPVSGPCFTLAPVTAFAFSWGVPTLFFASWVFAAQAERRWPRLSLALPDPARRRRR